MKDIDEFVLRATEVANMVHEFSIRRPRETVLGVLFYEASIILARVRTKLHGLKNTT
jgi:hypothetical protein